MPITERRWGDAAERQSALASMAVERAMHVTQTRLSLDDLGATMAQMREWLDEHGITPLTFHSHDGRGSVVIEISFSNITEAQQFAGHFGAAVLVD